MSEDLSESTVEMLVDEEEVTPYVEKEKKENKKESGQCQAFNYSRYEMKRIYDERKKQGPSLLNIGNHIQPKQEIEEYNYGGDLWSRL